MKLDKLFHVLVVTGASATVGLPGCGDEENEATTGGNVGAHGSGGTSASCESVCKASSADPTWTDCNGCCCWLPIGFQASAGRPTCGNEPCCIGRGRDGSGGAGGTGNGGTSTGGTGTGGTGTGGTGTGGTGTGGTGTGGTGTGGTGPGGAATGGASSGGTSGNAGTGGVGGTTGSGGTGTGGTGTKGSGGTTGGAGTGGGSGTGGKAGTGGTGGTVGTGGTAGKAGTGGSSGTGGTTSCDAVCGPHPQRSTWIVCNGCCCWLPIGRTSPYGPICGNEPCCIGRGR